VRAFLFPHQIVAPEIVYIAAVHRDEDSACAAFEQWIGPLDVGTIAYHHHKPIGLITARFDHHLDRFPSGGVLRNVARQGRLRAHANLDALRRLLAQDGVGAIGLVAMGGLRERLLAPAGVAGDVDALEFYVPFARWQAALETLAAAGWHPVSPPQSARGRHAMVAHLRQVTAQTPMRLLGFGAMPVGLLPVAGHDGLQVMSDAAHIGFVQSRRASLLLRRDQALFDIFVARHRAGSAGQGGVIDIAHLPWMFRRRAARILGLPER
jgi:hypothetical protein